MEILVRKAYTPGQVERAELRRDEFRRNRYTSGCAHLDDLITLEKCVVLCEAHTRKFSPKQARYRAHPDKKLRRVNGQCDVCRTTGLSFFFICERDAQEEQMKVEKFKRVLEYGHFFNG